MSKMDTAIKTASAPPYQLESPQPDTHASGVPEPKHKKLEHLSSFEKRLRSLSLDEFDAPDIPENKPANPEKIAYFANSDNSSNEENTQSPALAKPPSRRKLTGNSLRRTLTVNDHACIAQECKSSILSHFPTALKTHEIDARVATIAHGFEFTRRSTLVARCCCPDEINSNVSQLGQRFAGEFNLGGLAGIPFTGSTGMAAFAGHVPDDGCIIIYYGPHIGISDKGELGCVVRRGQDHDSSACGAAVAAMKGLLEDPNYQVPMETDHQQHVVVKVVAKQLDRLKDASEPMKELMDILYEEIERKLLKIMYRQLNNVQKKILLVGGIQVNTHHGLSDHFVPRTFCLLHSDGQVDLMHHFTSKKRYMLPPLKPIMPLAEPTKHILKSCFPDALLDVQVVLGASTLLRERGIHRDNTLFADSTCPDEINRIPGMFGTHMGSRFCLGGLTGISFAGRTGYAAFSHHVPKGGNIFLFYGPHVGVSAKGELGRVVRIGQSNETSACGSAIHAMEGLLDPHPYEIDREDDYQQWYVSECLRQDMARLATSENPENDAVNILYNVVERDLLKIVDTSFKGMIVLLGGIIVNVPESDCDYFEPRRFSIMEEGKFTQDLLPDLMAV